MKRALPLLLLIFQIFILTSNEAYAQNSTIVSPANNAVVPTSGFTVEVGPNPNASQRIVYILYESNGVQYSNSGPRYGTGTVTYTVPPGLPANTRFTVRVTTWTAVGVLNSAIAVTTSAAPAPSPAPIIVTPANGSVVPTTGFTVQVAANQYALQTNITVTEQATGALYTSSRSYYTTDPISFDVRPGLRPNTAYLISVTTRSVYGNYTSSVVVTTNSTPAPSPAPIIVTPANGSVVSTAGFTVQVAANQYALQTNIVVTEQATGALYASSQSYYTTGIINYNVRPGLKTNTAYVISVTTRSVYGNFTSTALVTTDNTPAPSPIPVIVSPENLSYVLAPNGFTVQVAPNPYATQVIIQVINLPSRAPYSTSQSFYTTGPVTYNVPAGLAVNTRYQVTATAYTEFGVYSSSATVSTFLQPSFLTAVEGQTLETTPVPVRYANAFTYPIAARAVPNSDQYVWELSVDSTFGSIAYTATTTAPNLQLTATTGGLVSGQQYFARVRGFRTATGAVSDASPARRFYNALHPMIHVDPLASLDRRRFGLNSSNIVANSDEWIFQVAEADNDSDPSNDFAPEKIFSNPAGWGGNNTHPGVAGNVFKANRVKTEWWGAQAAFGVIQAQPQTTYRVRVRAARKNPNGGYHQLGYWSDVYTFSTNAVPDRVHPLTNIPDGATNVENRESAQFTRIAIQGMALLWDITAYQLQVSESPDFTTNVLTTPEDAIAFNNTSGVTEGNPVFFVRNLKFNTTYYARARSLATVKGVRNVVSSWGPVTRFTTKPDPAGRVASQGQGAQSHSFEAGSYVAPNPFADAVRLKLDAAYDNAQVRIVNNLGQEVSRFTAAGSQEVVLGKEWPKGLYLIQVYHENGLRETIRIVKQ